MGSRRAGGGGGARAGGGGAGGGDGDGNGHPDLLIGASTESSGATQAGAVYLLLGPRDGNAGTLSDADAKLTGVTAFGEVGRSMDAAGDFNADGYDDLIIGSRYDNTGGGESGTAFIVFGPVSGESSLAGADVKLTGESIGDYAGYAVAGMGDANDDGNDDVAVGAYGCGDEGAMQGCSYVVLGGRSGTLSLATADVRLLGEEPGDQAGVALDSAGDMNGDGDPDLLIGAWYHDGGFTQAGAAYVVYGP